MNREIFTTEELQAFAKTSKMAETHDFIKLYFLQAAQAPLLTPEEEVRLATCIAQGKQAEQELAHADSLTSKKKQKLETVVAEAMVAREVFITANVRLVISIAKSYRGRGVSFLDLIQDGNEGLLVALEKFDVSLGNKFSTYASWWIRQKIHRAIDNNSRSIRLPVNKTEFKRTLHRIKGELSKPDPTYEEIAQKWWEENRQKPGMTWDTLPSTQRERLIEKVEITINLGWKMVSWDALTNEGEGAEYGEVFGPDAQEDVAESAELTVLEKEVWELLSNRDLFTEREQVVLAHRYGLHGYAELTYEKIGELFGLGREGIRKIERKVRDALRENAVAQSLWEAYVLSA